MVNMRTGNLFICNSEIMRREIIRLSLKLLFIGGVIFATIIYCEIRLRDIPNSYTIKKYYLEKDLNDIQVLILGSSHTYFGINPEFFNLKGYNLANASQTLYYDKELLGRYIDRMPNLKIVIISYSYFALWTELYENVENWRDYCYYHFWGIKPNNSKLFDIKQVSYIALYGTSFVQNAFFTNFKMEVNDYFPRPNGSFFNENYNNLDTSDLLGKNIIMYYDSLMRDEHFSNNCKNLETILLELTKKILFQ